MPIGSYVEVSAGGDSDVLSFYSTTAASTWKDPGKFLATRKLHNVETGFSKNAVARYQITDDDSYFTTTYRRAVHENLSRLMSAGKYKHLVSFAIFGNE